MSYIVYFSLLVLLAMATFKAVLVYPLIYSFGLDWFWTGCLFIIITILYYYLLSLAIGFLRTLAQFLNIF